NFWNALKPELPLEYQSKTLEDFLPLCKEIFNYIQQKKEERKLKTKEQRLLEAKEKEQIKEKYGWAILNGERQPIASPMIEGPGIFIARGEHPQLGAWKFRVNPEDVNVNATNNVRPPVGHNWKSCKENKGSMELCSYKMKTSTGSMLFKRILFSATSTVKQNADQKKFEKAQKLISHWEELKSHIEKNISSKDPVIKQSAMVTWLIMNLGIRVGDEKGEDKADTVGASSLRFEHLTIKDHVLKLSFDGKDSVHYSNSIELPDYIEKELSLLLNGKKKGEMVFPDVTSREVKHFISHVIDGISAKVFRTAWGSSLLAYELQNAKVKPTMTTSEKIAIFDNASLEVSKKLNHQKNVGKNFELKSEEMNIHLQQMKDNYNVIEKTIGKQIKELKVKIDKLDEKKYNANDRALLKKNYKDKIKRLQERLNKKKKQITDFKLKKELKEKTKNISLGTARAAYSDPRIGMSFCKTFDIPLEKVYNKSMQAKFSWALNCKKNYFLNYKIIES
ncbi:DNA topoisomerase I, partial [Patescibacteria group bacterium]|nr:DNA topoisomerase I [Patescibacteria group bacterium]